MESLEGFRAVDPTKTDLALRGFRLCRRSDGADSAIASTARIGQACFWYLTKAQGLCKSVHTASMMTCEHSSGSTRFPCPHDSRSFSFPRHKPSEFLMPMPQSEWYSMSWSFFVARTRAFDSSSSALTIRRAASSTVVGQVSRSTTDVGGGAGASPAEQVYACARRVRRPSFPGSSHETKNGARPKGERRLVTLNFTSWNQIGRWLSRLHALKNAA